MRTTTVGRPERNQRRLRQPYVLQRARVSLQTSRATVSRERLRDTGGSTTGNGGAEGAGAAAAGAAVASVRCRWKLRRVSPTRRLCK